jgi:predicted nuclease of predicted toxin-antitoxin system
VKLLFDQNLSARRIGMLLDGYPDAVHVRLLGLSTADDDVIWQYARRHDCIIVSKDADFFHRSMRFGPPPKVVWIRAGNCTTGTIAQLLRRHVGDIRAFTDDAEAAFLPLGYVEGP